MHQGQFILTEPHTKVADKFGGKSCSLLLSSTCSDAALHGTEAVITKAVLFSVQTGWNLKRRLCHGRRSAGFCLRSFTEAVNNVVTDTTVEDEIFILDQRRHWENSLGPHSVLLQQQQTQPLPTLSPKSLAWETEKWNFPRMLLGLRVSSCATCLLCPRIPSPAKLLQWSWRRVVCHASWSNKTPAEQAECCKNFICSLIS